MKIRITESDIVSMVVESVGRVLNERTQGGYETGSVEWIPFEDNEDRMCDLYDKKIIPEGLYYASFDIEATRSCTNYSDSRREIAPYSDYGDVSYSGDYDEAIKLINQVTDPNVKNELMNSLNAALESIDFDDFEEYEPDPDDYYDSRRDDGRLEEAREYDTWLGHSDIPGSDGRFFNVVFYLDNNGQINYKLNGDSSQKVPEPIIPKPGSWLDTQIRNYMEEHMGEIKANLFI